MTGKLADTVMSVRNGQQIARKYQPVVFNPNTPAQIAQRAKLKLITQLSAVMAPVIAIPRVGGVSSRNLFTKKNFSLASYSNNEATINLNGIQLTSSSVGLPSVTAVRLENGIRAVLNQPIENIDRVVYAMFAKGSDNKLRLVDSQIATQQGSAESPWNVTFPAVADEVVVLAYGVRLNTETARAKFGNISVTPAEQIAKLIVTRTLTENDITPTETRGFTLSAQA